MGDRHQGLLKSQLGILQIPLVTVGAIWIAFFLDLLLGHALLVGFGLQPRTASGAWGILAMPFLHAGWGHLVSNTIPLLVLTTLLAITGKGWGTMAGLTILSGVLLWLFGRGGRLHVGASGLVYALAIFLICRGIVEKKLVLLLVSIAVGALYGTALLSGVIPTGGVSWDGHLFGGAAGAVLAFRLRRRPVGQRGAASGN